MATSGTYALSGTGRLSVKSEAVGGYGTGSFTQSGGTNTATTLLLAEWGTGSKGTYGLSTTGQLTWDLEYVGYAGSGGFGQVGGSNVAGSASISAAAPAPRAVTRSPAAA